MLMILINGGVSSLAHCFTILDEYLYIPHDDFVLKADKGSKGYVTGGGHVW